MRVFRGTDAGFTLVELTAIIAIVSVLLTIAIATYMSATQRAGGVACENNRRSIERVAVSEYRVENDSEPASISDLAPFFVDWSSTSSCPMDDSRAFFLDTDEQRIVCPLHGK